MNLCYNYIEGQRKSKRREAVSMKYKDYYKALEVDRNADQSVIKKAYRRLAKKYHPDAHANDKKKAEQFKEINEAYEVLGNPEKRASYDQISSQTGRFNGQEFDPGQFGFSYSNRTQSTGRQQSHDFSDFFNTFFSEESNYHFRDMYGQQGFQSFSDTSWGRQPDGYAAADAEATLELSLEEAFSGVEKRFTIRINGKEKSLSVKIPAGVLNEDRIKLKGQGHQISHDGVSGDLYLIIQIRQSPNMKLEGLDLIKTVTVSPWEAALGDEIMVDTLSGQVKFRLPPGTQSGKRFRFGGKGYRNRKGERGDLMIQIEITVPKTLSDQERKLFEELKRVSTYRPRS
jgi:curved DNA-binding protein